MALTAANNLDCTLAGLAEQHRRRIAKLLGNRPHYAASSPTLSDRKSGFAGHAAFEPNLGERIAETVPDGEIFEMGRVQVWHLGRASGFHLAEGEVRN